MVIQKGSGYFNAIIDNVVEILKILVYCASYCVFYLLCRYNYQILMRNLNKILTYIRYSYAKNIIRMSVIIIPI